VLGGRLIPAWAEALMGFPVGWTDPDIQVEPWHEEWPAPRIVGLDGASPQFYWEPARTVVGPPVRGRPARMRAIGNAVVPAQAIAAIAALLAAEEEAR